MLSRNGFLIIISYLVALFLSLMPIPNWGIWWRPEWIVLIIIFWIFLAPQKVGIGTSWVIGILLDLVNGTLLGEHALALVIITFLALKAQRQVRFFHVWQQALFVGFLILVYQLILYLIQGIIGQLISEWQFWLKTLSSVIVWPFVFYVMDGYQRRFRIR